MFTPNTMNWKELLSTQRCASPQKSDDIRTSFQRDYDRIIFSSVFRRLQNKTQVFPLPGAIMVHNRLTHSLEVASVGRSIARMTYQKLIVGHPELKDEISDIDTAVAAACLAHDIGNPPFGHSGENTSIFTSGLLFLRCSNSCDSSASRCFRCSSTKPSV